MTLTSPHRKRNRVKTRIVVIGIGGAGNAVNSPVQSEGVDFVACNTDAGTKSTKADKNSTWWKCLGWVQGPPRCWTRGGLGKPG